MQATQHQYGDRRLLVCTDERELVNRMLTREESKSWAPDVACAASVGLPPFCYIRIELCVAGGRLPLWETKAAIQTRPMPGWAARGACYCKTCGKVAQEGETLACDHNDASERR